jgi:hypothetical protein
MERVPGRPRPQDARGHAEHPSGRRRRKVRGPAGAEQGPVGPLVQPEEGGTDRNSRRSRERRSPVRRLPHRRRGGAWALPRAARTPGQRVGGRGRGGGGAATPPLPPWTNLPASRRARWARRGRATAAARQKPGRRGGMEAGGRRREEPRPSSPTAKRRRARGRRERSSFRPGGTTRGEGRGPVGPFPVDQPGAGRWALRLPGRLERGASQPLSRLRRSHREPRARAAKLPLPGEGYATHRQVAHRGPRWLGPSAGPKLRAEE